MTQNDSEHVYWMYLYLVTWYHLFSSFLCFWQKLCDGGNGERLGWAFAMISFGKREPEKLPFYVLDDVATHFMFDYGTVYIIIFVLRPTNFSLLFGPFFGAWTHQDNQCIHHLNSKTRKSWKAFFFFFFPITILLVLDFFVIVVIIILMEHVSQLIDHIILIVITQSTNEEGFKLLCKFL